MSNKRHADTWTKVDPVLWPMNAGCSEFNKLSWRDFVNPQFFVKINGFVLSKLAWLVISYFWQMTLTYLIPHSITHPTVKLLNGRLYQHRPRVSNMVWTLYSFIKSINLHRWKCLSKIYIYIIYIYIYARTHAHIQAYMCVSLCCILSSPWLYDQPIGQCHEMEALST